jgi:hypothetical protein
MAKKQCEFDSLSSRREGSGAAPGSRRQFLADVGRGMFVAGLGFGLATDLGLTNALACDYFDDDTERLTFGRLEPLVSLMQETPIAQLLPKLVQAMKEGTDLRTLVAAGALANARTFGGQDYTGYHAFMALPPALEMAMELPANRRALPVLKVLYRNSARIQEHGGTKNEILHPITHVEESLTGEKLQAATRSADFDRAESVFGAMQHGSVEDAYDALQYAIQDEIDVHRVVLSWRAWTMLDIAGKEYAHSLLRQSVRFCVAAEKHHLSIHRTPSNIRTLLPKLFDQHKLMAKGVGTRTLDDAGLHELTGVIYGGSREDAAGAVAQAMAEGYSVEAVGEAMSAAANMLVLRDPGRKTDEEGKPKGSVHGASVGVHASDSANAWRNIAAVSNARNQFASLIVGAFHTAGQSGGQKGELETTRLPEVPPNDPAAILAATELAIKANEQAVATGLIEGYGKAGYDSKPVFDLMLKYAVSEDGALHAEKYYRTVAEEFARTRESVRWQHLVALARVTASEHGFPAPGFAEASKLIGLP